MPALRDMALLVEEREKEQFYWAVIEALDDDASEVLHYRRFSEATVPQASYSNALVLGAAALRSVADADA